MDGGLIADGEFVVAGGDGPVAFEPVDAAFDGVPLFVDLRVEGGWPAAVVAPVLAVLKAVSLLGDGGGDAASAQVAAVGARPVGLVAQDPVWAGAGPARAQPETVIWSRTVVNWGLSPCCPAVITMDGGFWPCSTVRWILVVRPPRDRPRP